MLDWTNILLKPEATLLDAINVLDRESLRIVLVVDEQSRLLGTVTDGDIRRALIKYKNMDTRLSLAMSTEPTVAAKSTEPKAVLDMMQKMDLLHIPIVDEQGIVAGLETLQSLTTSKKKNNPVFLMAGGFGKRLHPLTKDIPKPLLKVGNKPILQTILEQFAEAGFFNFYISTHYKAEMVKEYFGNGEKWGVKIEYVHEEAPLGTAGSLGLLPSSIPNLPIVMMNGDLLTKVNFEYLLQFHDEQSGMATMCVREYDLQVPYGVVKAEGQYITSIVEKPVKKFFVNAGIYVLGPEGVRLCGRQRAIWICPPFWKR